MSDFGQRFCKFYTEMHIAPKEIARDLGVDVSTISRYGSSPKMVPVRLLEWLERKGLNLNWLATGEGPMLLSDIQPTESPAPASVDIEELAERVARLERQNAIAQAILNPPSGDRSVG